MTRNHDIEKIYMQQLKNIESTVQFLSKQKKEHENDIYNLRMPLPTPAKPRTDVLYIIGQMLEYIVVSFMMSFGIALYVGFCSLIIVIFSFIIALFLDLFKLNNDIFIAIIEKILIVDIAGLALLLVYIILNVILKIYNYITSIKNYNVQIKKNEPIYAANCAKAAEKEKQLLLINTDLHNALDVLNDLYSINWIPSNYRNIRVIYYIADMIETSDLDINTALNYYLLQETNDKLNHIINKIDGILESQNEILVKQAILESQNNDLIEQNKKMISQLADIEENSKLAVDYAKIATKYAKSASFFSSASYFSLGSLHSKVNTLN